MHINKDAYFADRKEWAVLGHQILKETTRDWELDRVTQFFHRETNGDLKQYPESLGWEGRTIHYSLLSLAIIY